MIMNRPIPLIAIAILATLSPLRAGDGGKSGVNVLRRPLSKVEALNIAIAHNGAILQAQKEVEAIAGVAIQTRAILLPKVTNSASYAMREDSLIEGNQSVSSKFFGAGTNNQAWSGDIQVVQSIYEGGRMRSAVRSSKLIQEQALLVFQSTVSDTLLSVSTAYDDVLSTSKQIEVRRASVTLLKEYLDVTTTKAKAGAVTEFDVLREEVEVANSEAALVQAIGAYRVAKQVFVELLGQNLPTTVSDNLSLNLTTPLEARPYRRELSSALAAALVNRTEIAALEKEERIRDENIIVAKAGTKPSVQAFAGYEMTSRSLSRNASDELHGALVGAQFSWPIFDGFLTKGRVVEAVARRGKASEAKAETTRIVEQQVRTAWSDLRTARAVLDAEGKNIEKAVKGLGLVRTRYTEGAATQVEVLSAQTALTDARTTYVQGLRDYSVARARLLRATGEDLQRGKPGK
jgi:outer membrane protein